MTYDNALSDALREENTEKGVMLEVATPTQLPNNRGNLDDIEYLRLRWPDAPLPIIHLALAALGTSAAGDSLSAEQSCSRDSTSRLDVKR